MKFAGIVAIASLAASVAAVPGWSEDATTTPAKTTTTTPAKTTTKAAVKTTTTTASTTSKAAATTTSTTQEWAQWEPTETEEPDSWTSSVLTAITTYVAKPTELVHAGHTYKITSATTLTITDCPCTVSVPVYTKTSTSCASTATVDSNVNANANGNGAVAPSNVYGTDVDAGINAAASSGANVAGNWQSQPSSATISPYTGAADRMAINAAASLAAVAGLAAMLL